MSAGRDDAFAAWTGAPERHHRNGGLAFQRWRRFKEAFAPEIVERALTESEGAVETIADPFGGSGTTALAAQMLGVEPTTIEVNPYLAELIEAKLAPIDCAEAERTARRVADEAQRRAPGTEPAFEGAPPTFVAPGVKDRYLFPEGVAREIVAYRNAIGAVTDRAIARLLRVMLASAAVAASNAVVSGKGRRYRRGWKTREEGEGAVADHFAAGVAQALEDLERYAGRKCQRYTVTQGDARALAAKIGPHQVAVFSPPYPNSFDYTDVYNIELWSAGYLRSMDASNSLRRETLRSHVQIRRPFDDDEVPSASARAATARLAAVREQLWNPHIPEMVSAYACDLARVLEGLAKGLRPRGRAYIVIGDSRYRGVDVPAAQIVAEVAQARGYEIVASEPARSMRASPQQGGRAELVETLIVARRR